MSCAIPPLLTAVYCAILALVGCVDLIQHRIPNVLVFPGIALALLASWWLPQPGCTFLSAIGGAAVGFVSFFALHWFGKQRYGPGALGMGDVKLAMLLGAMVGLRWVAAVLLLGILLAGLAAGLLLLVGRSQRHQHLPYGFYLSLAGILILVFVPLYGVN